jgi:competence protein ComEC
MEAIIRNFHPQELWLAPQVATGEFRRLLATAAEHGVAIRQYQAGDNATLGSVRFTVLSPPAEWELKQRVRDDDGLVLLAEAEFPEKAGSPEGARRIRRLLLPGDVGRKIEASLLERETNPTPGARANESKADLPGSQELRADVLKVGHHGSNTSSSIEFLAAVHPRFGVISAGIRNRFRHPRPEALGRLSEAGITVFRTDLMGATTFLLDGDAVSASTYNGASVTR